MQHPGNECSAAGLAASGIRRDSARRERARVHSPGRRSLCRHMPQARPAVDFVGHCTTRTGPVYPTPPRGPSRCWRQAGLTCNRTERREVVCCLTWSQWGSGHPQVEGRGALGPGKSKKGRTPKKYGAPYEPRGGEGQGAGAEGRAAESTARPHGGYRGLEGWVRVQCLPEKYPLQSLSTDRGLMYWAGLDSVGAAMSAPVCGNTVDCM